MKREARIPAGGSPASQMPFTSWAFLICWSPSHLEYLCLEETPTGSLRFRFCRPRGSQRPAALGGVWLRPGRGALPFLLGFPEPWGGQTVNCGVMGGGVVAGVRARSPLWDCRLCRSCDSSVLALYTGVEGRLPQVALPFGCGSQNGLAWGPCSVAPAPYSALGASEHWLKGSLGTSRGSDGPGAAGGTRPLLEARPILLGHMDSSLSL